MALLRDKAGELVYGFNAKTSRHEPVKTTNEGERKARELRLQKERAQQRVKEENQRARKKRSPEEQLAVLDARLGDGKGAVKERAKLHRQIEARLAAEQEAAEKRAEKAQSKSKDKPQKGKHK